jgi:hypothetical protein
MNQIFKIFIYISSVLVILNYFLIQELCDLRF